MVVGAALAAPRAMAPARAAAPRPKGPKAVAVETCTPRQEGEWRFVLREQLGVQARGRSGGEWVGLTAATDGFHDWAPLDDFKTTICGALAKFDTYEPNRERAFLRFLPDIPEHDWNIILVPTAHSIFDERFTLAQRLMERGHQGDLESCDGRPCFEAEVTPPARLLKANAAGRWLSACRRGQTLCAFGPWVGDGGHGYRPEVHPAERIWWRDGERLKLLAVQDASQRFGDHRQYQWADTSEPGRWHPWASPAMQGEFRVAFELAASSSLELRVDQLLEGNTRGVKPPLSEGSPQFTFTHDGAEKGSLRVVLGLGPASDRLDLHLSNLDLGPDEVCLRPDGRTLQGYLRIHDALGYRYQEGEGFDAFEVSAPGRPGEPASPSPTAGCPACAPGPAADTVASLHVAALVLAREEQVDPSPTTSEEVLADLLLAATEGELPRQMLTSAARRKPIDIALQAARRFRLSVRPHYDGPRGDRLQNAIDGGDADGLRKLLRAAGAPVPETVRWDVRVRNFTAGGGEQEGACRPVGERHLLEGDECAIDVPSGGSPDAVWGVRARAVLLDHDGKPIPEVTVIGAPAAATGTAEQEIRLASHFIRAPDVAARDNVLAWLGRAFVPKGDLVTAATSGAEVPMGEDLAAYRQAYYARMLRHGLVLATVDRRITLDELRQFVDMARLFAEPPPLGFVPAAPAVK